MSDLAQSVAKHGQKTRQTRRDRKGRSHENRWFPQGPLLAAGPSLMTGISASHWPRPCASCERHGARPQRRDEPGRCGRKRCALRRTEHRQPAIADFSTLSDRTIYVLGKAPGRTTLTLLDGTGRLITNVDVHVSTDISEFKERLRQILPGEGIEVRTANDGIVMSGTVSSAARMHRALDLAERYAPERVSNLMSVPASSRSCSRCASPKCSAACPRRCRPRCGRRAQRQRPRRDRRHQHDEHAGWDPEHARRVRPAANDNNARLRLRLRHRLRRGGHPARGAGNQGRRAHPGRAQPDRAVRAGGEFLAGGEYPVPVAQDSDTITIELQALRRRAQFRPPRRRRRRDQPRNGGGGVVDRRRPTGQRERDAGPAFRRRDTSTTVALRDGESFRHRRPACRTISATTTARCRGSATCRCWARCFAVPITSGPQTELVIIVSAHLVSPTRGEALALPTDRVQAAVREATCSSTDAWRRPKTRCRRRGRQAGFHRLLWLCDGMTGGGT